MIAQLSFWAFVALHLWKAVQTLLYAEDLERAKRANTDLRRPWRGPAKILVGAMLFVPGFIYARLAYLWLLLATITLAAGVFALSTAAAYRLRGASGAELIPEQAIPARGRSRRLAAVVEIMLVLTWTWAWRGVAVPLLAIPR